ncbi:metal-dependent hydrolase [Balneolaceae bacterium ANBcel3]|nr:metal-dependent hydrolase [Balneolaceae bacterium ANBcel3]
MKHAYWLGHSSFLFITSSGKRLLIDPFLKDNPVTPEAWKTPDSIDYIFLTHGHDDHAADVLELAKNHQAKVISIVELSGLLKADGLPAELAVEMNKGGTINFGDFKVTMTSANHSSSWKGAYAGDPAGFIFSFQSLSVYHAGDTNIMSDFTLYSALYKPDVAILPIGDHYTMGPTEASFACEMLKAKYAVPMHYGTMPVLTGDPEVFRMKTEKRTENYTTVITPEPGVDFNHQLVL